MRGPRGRSAASELDPALAACVLTDRSRQDQDGSGPAARRSAPIDWSVNQLRVANIRARNGPPGLARCAHCRPRLVPKEARLEDLRPGQRGAGRRGPEAHRPQHDAPRPQRREEPQPVRHPRDRGRDADQGGRRDRGRGGRRGDDGPRLSGPRAAQGGRARRRPLGPPLRRRARRAPTSARPATRWPRCSSPRARTWSCSASSPTTASATRSAPSSPTT